MLNCYYFITFFMFVSNMIDVYIFCSGLVFYYFNFSSPFYISWEHNCITDLVVTTHTKIQNYTDTIIPCTCFVWSIPATKHFLAQEYHLGLGIIITEQSGNVQILVSMFIHWYFNNKIWLLIIINFIILLKYIR